MINLKDCFEKKLLKKDLPSTNLAKKSLKQAEFFLNEAHDLLNINKKIIAAITLYNAFFQVVRALLFKDGIKERSHYCMARYLEEKYIKKKKLDKVYLNSFESLMSLRNSIQYSTEKTIIEEDLSEYYNLCEKFIKEVEWIIK